MALTGLRLLTDYGKGRELVGELRLDRETKKVTASDTALAPYIKKGVSVHPNDQGLARSLGSKFKIKMPKPSKAQRTYTAADGAQFLVAVMSKFARSTYSQAQPIKD